VIVQLPLFLSRASHSNSSPGFSVSHLEISITHSAVASFFFKSVLAAFLTTGRSTPEVFRSETEQKLGAAKRNRATGVVR
jgi:hypothetical protein